MLRFGSKVQVAGLRIRGSGSRVKGLGFRGLGFEVQVPGSRVWGLAAPVLRKVALELPRVVFRNKDLGFGV
jgi:hypothetical protein